MNDTAQRKRPIEEHRDGRLKAAIWENLGEKGKAYNTTLSYSYRDKEGSWRDTNSIPGHELLKAARLAEMAYASVQRLKEQDRAVYIEQQKTGADRGPQQTYRREH